MPRMTVAIAAAGRRKQWKRSITPDRPTAIWSCSSRRAAPGRMSKRTSPRRGRRPRPFALNGSRPLAPIPIVRFRSRSLGKSRRLSRSEKGHPCGRRMGALLSSHIGRRLLSNRIPVLAEPRQLVEEKKWKKGICDRFDVPCYNCLMPPRLLRGQGYGIHRPQERFVPGKIKHDGLDPEWEEIVRHSTRSSVTWSSQLTSNGSWISYGTTARSGNGPVVGDLGCLRGGRAATSRLGRENDPRRLDPHLSRWSAGMAWRKSTWRRGRDTRRAKAEAETERPRYNFCSVGLRMTSTLQSLVSCR